jgi:hypothetical protein
VIQPIGQQGASETSLLRRRARFVVVPSDWDVFNFTAAEAMSEGCLVVCSDGAGARDLIDAGETGFTFRAGDAQDLADCIRTAMELEPSVAKSVGARARAAVNARLDADVVARERLVVYRDLAVSRAPASDWLRSFFSGHDSARVGLAFLDQMSIRALSQYLGARVRRRVMPHAVEAADGGGDRP